MSDTPFGFGLPPEEPENGDEGKKKDQQSGGGQGPANPFGFGGLPGAGGFGAPGGPGADNPLAAMFGSLNPNDLGAAFQQLGQMLSYEGGPVNWDMAKQIARQTVSQGTSDGVKDASVGSAERTAVQEAVRLADLWLDDATSLPSGAGSAVAWSRAAGSIHSAGHPKLGSQVGSPRRAWWGLASPASIASTLSARIAPPPRFTPPSTMRYSCGGMSSASRTRVEQLSL